VARKSAKKGPAGKKAKKASKPKPKKKAAAKPKATAARKKAASAKRAPKAGVSSKSPSSKGRSGAAPASSPKPKVIAKSAPASASTTKQAAPNAAHPAAKGKGGGEKKPRREEGLHPAELEEVESEHRELDPGDRARVSAGEAPIPPPSRRKPKPGSPDWPGESLTVGMEAPDFSLPSTTGERITLSRFRGRRVVLYFYPKDDTPGCTMEACAFRDNMARIEAKDAVVLGVSLDDELSHQRFTQKYNLPFPLLADMDAAVSRKYGTYKEKNLYGRTFWGIERTTFVIDRDGKVENVFRRVKVEGHADEVLATLSV
jgi:peroxiredoxin Q/BCP